MDTPHILSVSKVITGSGRGVLSAGVSVSEEFEGARIWFLSTGAFSIEGIRTSDGIQLASADADNPILSTALFKPQSAGEGVGTFIAPLKLAAGRKLEVSVLDTSTSSNTVRMWIEGVKRPVT